MPSSGGLSPQEIEARNLRFLAHDLITKTVRYSVAAPFPVPVARFVPDQNYWMMGCDVVAFTPGSAAATSVSITYAGSPAVLGQPGSTGTSILELIGTNISKFFNWDPYGFYLEKGRALNVFVSTPSIVGTAFGNIQLFMIPTWTK
jgi:hypothetical protein